MQEFKKGKNKFYIGEDHNTPLAEITFVFKNENKIIIDHTRVCDALKNQGVGQKLVKLVIEYARQANKKIIPVCPFAKKIMTENEDCQDLLEKT
jgi:hypothetical protein